MWKRQKYMENGEYLRSSEIDEEQNYNMIDGRRNNEKKKKAGLLCWQSCGLNRHRSQNGVGNLCSR